MKNQKGITLIALVITIIVLLILAGISIAMLAGDNGVLTKASDSKIVNAISAKKDECALAAAEALSDYYESIYVNNTSSSAYSASALESAISSKINTKVKTDGDVTVTVSGSTITLDSKARPKDVDSKPLYTIGTIGNEGGLTWNDHFSNN